VFFFDLFEADGDGRLTGFGNYMFPHPKNKNKINLLITLRRPEKKVGLRWRQSKRCEEVKIHENGTAELRIEHML